MRNSAGDGQNAQATGHRDANPVGRAKTAAQLVAVSSFKNLCCCTLLWSGLIRLQTTKVAPLIQSTADVMHSCGVLISVI